MLDEIILVVLVVIWVLDYGLISTDHVITSGVPPWPFGAAPHVSKALAICFTFTTSPPRLR
jgi:hypothetical protein